jgi:hypothetical protein
MNSLIEKVAIAQHEAWLKRARSFPPSWIAEVDKPFDELKDSDKASYLAEAEAAIKTVIKDQMEWSKNAGYNDWVRLVFRNFGLLNEIEL